MRQQKLMSTEYVIVLRAHYAQQLRVTFFIILRTDRKSALCFGW